MKLFGIVAALIASADAQAATCGKYGCSKKMDTTGCSSQTGSQVSFVQSSLFLKGAERTLKDHLFLVKGHK